MTEYPLLKILSRHPVAICFKLLLMQPDLSEEYEQAEQPSQSS